ncbi:ABC-type transporter involved in resistance to organic solvents, toluene tolerance protein [Desulforapulum autotrophicum HRM2]|uniref:ABC-type transporter involved in resistance to organic solvents, toluene tolerance protein n=1 Tax=Desulforapulum autotrophicum (strain ATCC 43914 / DSM 3382 / VKM B-1955 / HRM2) TaxID=177437 RepID=C0QDN5_DESAH|nr:ABC transporter substrate-binding protein [Desulforapulum autotrophicum]ACN15299.1 ABC-type transporter involved in resistance to organic solvents, toluene tolerance protein [Desulforapulum autotrophicum HRM2]
MIKKIVFIIVMVMICAGSTFSLAQAQEELPGVVLKRCIDDVILILNEPVETTDAGLVHRNQRLFDKAGEVFDFASLSMGALGSNWRRFSPIQRTEFIGLFSHVVADSYFSRMEGHDFADVLISYDEAQMLPPTSSGVRRADIPTLVSHNGVKTPVVYRMLEKNSAWKVYDVIIEGVSMVANYREQYRVRFMDTPESMIAELKKKVAK